MGLTDARSYSKHKHSSYSDTELIEMSLMNLKLARLCYLRICSVGFTKESQLLLG